MENRIIELPEGSKMDTEFIKRLDSFFDSVPPSGFRDTLIEIYHNYIIREHQAFPSNFDQMCTQMYLFIDLLGRARENDEQNTND